MLDLPRVVKRGRIHSSQITPKGVEALQIASANSNRKIWKHLLIGEQNRWDPSTANRVINELTEGGYIERQDNAIPTRRQEYVLTKLGQDVISKYKIPEQGMSVRGLFSNMGGGLFVVTLNDSGFGMTSGSYFSAPIGLEGIHVKSIIGDPVLGLETKICPKCGKVNADERSCIRCGAPLQSDG
jgi:predicted transcriptional regulator